MRLSSRLSEKDKRHGEVESFIDPDKYTAIKEEETSEIKHIKSGDFIELQIGRINLPFYSTLCKDINLFISDKTLHCLIVNEKLISIDCQLTCTDFDVQNPRCEKCNHCIQAWFLVEADDIFSSTPVVNVVKNSFKFSNNIKLPVEVEGDIFSELLDKAEIAYGERLGAGAIVYLRCIFEKITHEVGVDAGIEIYKLNGKAKPFEQVLKIVDSQCSIIPESYSENAYELFSKLSEIAHGNSNETTALEEYESLRRLVIGIIENVKKKSQEIKNNLEIQKALKKIGFIEEDKGCE